MPDPLYPEGSGGFGAAAIRIDTPVGYNDLPGGQFPKIEVGL